MHYHSTCYGCLTTKELQVYQDSQGEAQAPGGVAFETEALAQADTEHENAQSYMRGWTGHKQVVAPCMSMHCTVQSQNHKAYWSR
jgi:hypothetical protein